MNQLPALCVLKDDQGHVLFTNDQMNAMMHFQHRVEHTAHKLLPQVQAESMTAADRRILERGIPEVGEVTLDLVTGESRIYETHRFPIKRQGKSDILGSIALDITARRQVEDELRQSLQEKDVLLREVHHRVKNNLNIMTSLLRLQASTIRTPEQALLAVQNTRDRILSMALVHEELYRSRDYHGSICRPIWTRLPGNSCGRMLPGIVFTWSPGRKEWCWVSIDPFPADSSLTNS